MTPELIELLACPETKAPVRLLSPPEVERLNSLITAGSVRTPSGAVVTEPITDGLIREDNARAYRIREGIPIMLISEGMDLSGPWEG